MMLVPPPRQPPTDLTASVTGRDNPTKTNGNIDKARATSRQHSMHNFARRQVEHNIFCSTDITQSPTHIKITSLYFHPNKKVANDPKPLTPKAVPTLNHTHTL